LDKASSVKIENPARIALSTKVQTVVDMKFLPITQGGEAPSIAGSLKLGESERWYVVMTQPNKEYFAAENLTAQGFRSFVPRQSVTYKHARRFSTKLAPVFPQYLFVILDPDAQRWRAVNGTFGVRRLINDGDRPAPVRVGVIETLAASCDASGVLMFRTATFKAGDRIRLVSGPFAGALGTLQSLDASGRVRLLLEIISGRITGTADASDVVLAN
jgi:transcription antitermination factor NusG